MSIVMEDTTISTVMGSMVYEDEKGNRTELEQLDYKDSPSADPVTVWKREPRYVWKKYNCNAYTSPGTWGYSQGATETTGDRGTAISTSVYMDTSDGVWKSNGGFRSVQQAINENPTGNRQLGMSIVSTYSAYRWWHNGAGTVTKQLFTSYYTPGTTTYSQGSTYYGEVESTNKGAYPTNGRHSDGYWYVYQRTY